MKKETGWRITTFEVTVKHRPNHERKYIKMDIKHIFEYEQGVKAVQVKVKK